MKAVDRRPTFKEEKRTVSEMDRCAALTAGSLAGAFARVAFTAGVGDMGADWVPLVLVQGVGCLVMGIVVEQRRQGLVCVAA